MNYHDITYPDMNNGDGLRVVLWLSGCEHHCKGCQNPQTWDINSGIPFDENAEDELFKELNKEYISGLTLSGGDPLHEKNLDDVLNLINKITRLSPKKNIWLYTGYDFNLLQDKMNEYKYTPFAIDANKWLTRWEIVSKCNILVDGRYIDSQRDVSLEWRGSKNQKVIDVQESLKQGEVILWHSS